MEQHLKIIGYSFLILGSIHAFFPRYFNWKEEFKTLSLINRQMTYVHTFFIGLLVVLLGLLLVFHAHDLLFTPFGKSILIGLLIFWGIRMILQHWGYSHLLWKGKRFETIVHIAFSLYWIYINTVFFLSIYHHPF